MNRAQSRMRGLVRISLYAYQFLLNQQASSVHRFTAMQLRLAVQAFAKNAWSRPGPLNSAAQEGLRWESQGPQISPTLPSTGIAVGIASC